jgi:hypothetical protein
MHVSVKVTSSHKKGVSTAGGYRCAYAHQFLQRTQLVIRLSAKEDWPIGIGDFGDIDVCRPEDVLARFPSRVVFIGGGPPVYAAYAPFIRHWDINRLPYNGEADRWFDPATCRSTAPASSPRSKVAILSRCRLARALSWSRRRRLSFSRSPSTKQMTAQAPSGSARPRERPAGSACVECGLSTATTVRCGNRMSALTSGATGVPRQRQRLGSIRCR